MDYFVDMIDIYKDVDLEIETSLIFVPNYTKYFKYFIWTILIKFFGGKYNQGTDEKPDYRWKRLYNHKWRFYMGDCIGSEYRITIRDKDGGSTSYKTLFG